MNRYPDRGLHGRVVDELGLLIVSGQIAAGATLDTEELGASYDVSRTVLREALKVLAGKGLTDARPRRGTFVRARRHWNLLDPDVLRWQFASTTDLAMFDRLHEVRVLLEPGTAELAAQRRTDDDVVALFSAVEDMALEGATASEIADADLRFHLGLITATHNELIEQLSVVIGIGLAARDQYVHTHEVSIENGLVMHRLIAEAVRMQDADKARRQMSALLDTAARDVRQLNSATTSQNGLAPGPVDDVSPKVRPPIT